MNVICGRRFAVSILLLAISSSSQIGILHSQGRVFRRPENGFPKRLDEDSKLILRAQIGSRPPRCDRRCSGCTHCEAVQVPTNPQPYRPMNPAAASSVPAIASARGGDGDGFSNYKPMSWKCKCGNTIFNP
ncbi:hypothetical protein M569_12442 [Genlisea aurea]|uniref:Epidermal patterning factor-like protein n=1 Tax=Genlisea aurea TaxID=192259 RepID=S8C6I7_9LAMI|nr:hypothetical protein M569_12442 [Genlisea aurea]